MAKGNKQSRKMSATTQNAGGTPSPELLGRFLDVQQKEIQLRAEELSLRVQQDQNNKEIAEKSITANITDREHGRSHARGMTKIVLAAGITLAVIISLVICYALYSGKDAVAMEIIKALIFVSTGGAGGYAIGTTSAKKQDSR